MLVRKVLGEGYNVQFRIATGVAGAQLLAVGFMWKRGNVVV